MVNYLIVLVFMVGLALGNLITCMTMPEDTQCDCSVNVGNQSRSVEDTFEAMAEGLSADQADEVQIMINNSCECCR